MENKKKYIIEGPKTVGYVKLNEKGQPYSKICKRKQDAKAMETKATKARIANLFKNNQ